MTAQTRLPFELDQRPEAGVLTAHGGVPLLIEAFRTSGAAAVLNASVVIKRRKRGLAPSELVEGLLSLWAAGGERCEDLAPLREDAALALLLGHGLPAPQTARDFLEAFGEAAPPLWQGERAAVPGEGPRLHGLAHANRRLVAWLQQRAPRATATIDVDATILESHKRSALATYDGRTGYQPVVALWAEQDVILADEFRDGNVPAGTGNRRLVERAVAALPPGVDQILVRADSAAYEHELLRWLAARGFGYGISADMRAAPRRPPRSALGARRASWRRRSAPCPRAPGRSSARTAMRSGPGPRWRTCRATVSRPRTARRRRAI